MKKVLFVFVLLAVAVSAMKAQDVITLKNGDEIKTKVLEVSTNEVKYKKFGSESGPTYTILKSEIFMIKYENGEKDMFDKTPAKPVETEAKANVERAERAERAERTERAVRSDAPSQRAQRDNASSATQGSQQNRATQSRAVAERQEPKVEAYQENVSVWPYRKAYIGFGVGPAFLTGGDLDSFGTGVQVNFNFGYLVSKNVGFTATIFSTDFTSKYTDDVSIGLQGFFVGPLFSTPLGESEKVEFDFKPMIGYAKAHATIGSKSGVTTDDGVFALGAGASLRFNLSTRFSLSGNLDYYHGEVGGVDLSSFGITIGANYRF
jgi:hypothetical protein